MTWRDDERVATARLAYAAMHWKYAMAEARRLLGATNVEECTALAAEAEAIGDAYAEAVASAVLAEQHVMASTLAAALKETLTWAHVVAREEHAKSGVVERACMVLEAYDNAVAAERAKRKEQAGE